MGHKLTSHKTFAVKKICYSKHLSWQIFIHHVLINIEIIFLPVDYLHFTDVITEKPKGMLSKDTLIHYHKTESRRGNFSSQFPRLEFHINIE